MKTGYVNSLRTLFEQLFANRISETQTPGKYALMRDNVCMYVRILGHAMRYLKESWMEGMHFFLSQPLQGGQGPTPFGNQRFILVLTKPFIFTIHIPHGCESSNVLFKPAQSELRVIHHDSAG